MCGGVLLLLVIIFAVLFIALSSSSENFKEHNWCTTYFDECFRQCSDEAYGPSDLECAKVCHDALKVCHREGRFPSYKSHTF